MRPIFSILALALAAQVVMSDVRAEEPVPPPKAPEAPKAANPPAADNNNNGGGGRGGRTRGWGGGGGGIGGQPGQGGPGGPGGGFMGGRGMNIGALARMAGIDFQEPTTAPKVDQLPLGANFRMVTEIPVGGVDNFSAPSKGWKVESVFTLSPDQTKAIDALREQYDAEQKKLGDEIVAQEKALAEKVIQLRQTYEKKANDVLSANDKPIKEKMDALSADVAQRNQKEMTDTVPLYDTKDNTQMFTLIRALRDKISKNIQDAEDKLLDLLPADNKAKLQDALKAQQATRDRQAQLLNFIGNGGPGGPAAPGGAAQQRGFGGGIRGRGQGGGAGGEDAVKPPRPPETEKF